MHATCRLKSSRHICHVWHHLQTIDRKNNVTNAHPSSLKRTKSVNLAIFFKRWSNPMYLCTPWLTVNSFIEPKNLEFKQCVLKLETMNPNIKVDLDTLNLRYYMQAHS
jgi:hypothetical protein